MRAKALGGVQCGTLPSNPPLTRRVHTPQTQIERMEGNMKRAFLGLFVLACVLIDAAMMLVVLLVAWGVP